MAEAKPPTARGWLPLPRAPAAALGIWALGACGRHLLFEFAECDRSRGWQVEGQEEVWENLTQVHVVYSSDVNNFPGLYISMLSLSRRMRRPETCSIHVIVPRRDAERAAEFVDCFRSELEDEMPRLPEVILEEARPLPFNLSGFATDVGTVNPLAFSKLLLTSYESLRHVPRVVWLDTDTVVLTDISRLFRVRMRHPVAATLDHAVRRFSYHRQHMPASVQEAVLDWDGRTFCSGVMVFDLQRWRREDFTGRLAGFAEALRGRDGEQLPLNLLFQGRVDLLDNRWSVHVSSAHPLMWLTCLQMEIWALHMVGPVKYWHRHWLDDMSWQQFAVLLERFGLSPRKGAQCPVLTQLWRTGPSSGP